MNAAQDGKTFTLTGKQWAVTHPPFLHEKARAMGERGTARARAGSNSDVEIAPSVINGNICGQLSQALRLLQSRQKRSDARSRMYMPDYLDIGIGVAAAAAYAFVWWVSEKRRRSGVHHSETWVDVDSAGHSDRCD
ncbi:hypothetical protein Q0601_11000 [Paracoccus onubensis]|uniref:hypothetical protein n=1 Tax=Paracoccus onubensis TaxID=1675788 RepID=UPI0027312A49|nr:hypothetical protein [Paracoccus onubensis]MDP0927703.1 hypothetical protein [Paracoccus onubensis]